MAWFDRNKGYKTYGGNGYPEHGHRPVILGPNGKKYEVVGGYSSTHSSQSYQSTTEEVVQFKGGAPAIAEFYDHSPKKNELMHKNHGASWDEPAYTRPWSPAHGHVGHGSNKDSPRYHRATSPPPRVHYSVPHDYGKSENPSDDENDYSSDDDVVYEDGVWYKKDGLKKPVYDKENHKGYNFSPPSYPKQDPYYPNNHNDKHKGNGYIAPAAYDVPVSSPKKLDAFHDRYNNKAHPQPIKTRVDTNQAIGFMPDTQKNSPRYAAVHQPQYKGSPQRDHGRQETIDSAEAHRRYGKGSPQYGAYGEQQYYNGKTIDCMEAAKKYNGVLVAK